MEASENHAALRAARSQSLFRSINQRIEELNETFGLVLDAAEYVCECADDSCMERIVMSMDEYRQVRRVPTHFFVKPTHLDPDIERVVEQHDAYNVVEKFGDAGAEAVELARASVGEAG